MRRTLVIARGGRRVRKRSETDPQAVRFRAGSVALSFKRIRARDGRICDGSGRRRHRCSLQHGRLPSSDRGLHRIFQQRALSLARSCRTRCARCGLFRISCSACFRGCCERECLVNCGSSLGNCRPAVEGSGVCGGGGGVRLRDWCVDATRALSHFLLTLRFLLLRHESRVQSNRRLVQHPTVPARVVPQQTRHSRP